MMQGFKHTEVGVIPSDWEVTKLGDVSDIKTGPFGSALHEKDYVADGTPIITVEHLSEFGVVHRNIPMVSDTDKKRLNSYSMQTNDIVFSRVGSVDRNSIVTELERGWLFSGRLLRIRISSKNVNPKYLSFHFQQESFKQRIRSVAVGQTMASLNTQILKGIDVALPPTLTEQTAIATALNDADALIQKTEQLIAKKRNIKTGAMQELLRPKEGWVVRKLGEVCEKIVGGGTPSRSNVNYWNGDIPWVTVKDFATYNAYITQEYITKEGLKNSAANLIPKHTLITSTRMGLGKAVIYKVDVSINQDLKAIFPISALNTKFLFYWFQKNANLLSEMGSGSTVMGLSLNDLKGISFSLPSVTEQTRIARILSDMDNEIQELEKQWEKYKMIKQGMMQSLLTGKIRLI